MVSIRDWVLTGPSFDQERWIQYALSVLEVADPERFPARSEWPRRREWMTPIEVEIIDGLREIEQERAAASEKWEAREIELEAELVEASARAARGERQLLTARGADLTLAVAGCLRDLGFDVSDSDAIRPERQRAPRKARLPRSTRHPRPLRVHLGHQVAQRDRAH